MQRASCVSFSLLGGVRLSSASLALSLFDRRIHARLPVSVSWTLFSRWTKKEGRVRKKDTQTHECWKGVRFCFCFLKFPFAFSFWSTNKFFSSIIFIILRCFFCLVTRWCAKNLNFSHVLEERDVLLSSQKRKDKQETQHVSINLYLLFGNELSSSPPSPHKIKGKRHASSPSNDDDDVDSRDLQMLLLLCVVVGVGVFSVFFED